MNKELPLCKEKPELIALDLDGTLLNSDHKVTEKTAAVIESAVAAGIHVVISTGRSYEGMMHYKNQLNLKSPVICYNGAMIADGATDQVLHEWLLPSDITREVYGYARERDFHIQVFQDGELYFEKRREEAEYYENATGLSGRLTDFDTWENLDVTKALMILPPSRESGEFPELHEAQSFFRDKYGERLYCALSKPFYLEFINGKGSKGHALDQLGLDLGIPREKMAAFGDGFNDLEMLEHAGISVAMANAPEGVKEGCRYVTERSNDEDGVAHFIEKYIL
ncbi:MAG: Cof-type HAD-IIB family hydrolase [Spirochaetales bacterium]|nr:Cof-type HAD-IIB family hydrolase [Spirochaetales bacterium]